MKIEMGESLFLSWLRHVKQCQIVQLNWKTSTSWQLSNEQQVEKLMNHCRSYFRKKYGRELLGRKGGQSYTQILKQGEIDVLGIELSKNSIASIYAVDVAFHEHGLRYGKTPQDAVTRVVKKMIRSTMIIMSYFGMNKGDIIFASPKINPSTYMPLQKVFDDINSLMRDMKLKFTFLLYGNSDFEKHIIAPVVQLSNEVADTSELFMRSIQMYHLFVGKGTTIRPQMDTIQRTVKETPQSTDEIKIGQLVRTTFRQLFANRKVTKRMADSLMDLEYSKQTFGLSFPVLRRIGDRHPLSKQIQDDKGRSRYWSEEFGNGRYLICSQWYARHRKKFLDWVSKLRD